MRKRSGAIHCESVEEFLNIAEAVDHRPGVFYDEKVNQSVTHLLKQKHSMQAPSASVSLSPSQNSKGRGNQFFDFEFSEESEEVRDERQEVGRGEEVPKSVVNIGVVGQCLADSRRQLEGGRQSNMTVDEGRLQLDLHILRKENFIFKCWLFQQKYLSDSPLLEFYLKKCQLVLVMGSLHQPHQISLCKSESLRAAVQRHLLAS